MNTTTLTGREYFTKHAFWLGPGGPIDKENQAKMYKKYCYRYITLFEMVKIWISIKQSDLDSYQIEKQDPDWIRNTDLTI
jgi:hypothetical protein